MILINDKKYELAENVKDGFDLEAVKVKLTDYFDEYDYIVGDWAYGKLRLKGFNDKENQNFNAINDATLMKSYIEEYCAYGCKYFILKKIKG